MSNKRRDYLRKEDTEGFPGSTQITKRTQQSVENQCSEKNLRELAFLSIKQVTRVNSYQKIQTL